MRPSSQRAPRPPQAESKLTFPIPHPSAAAFTAHKNKSPQNAGLIFDRFAPDTRDSDGAKKAGFEQVRQAAKNADTALLAAFNARWEREAQAVGAQSFTLKTDWRFITGLGRKGPLEAGFTFNRYGFPILPGSSVKGIARAYALLVKGVSETDKDFVEIFGRAPKSGEDQSVTQSGGAIFFDAIPAGKPTLELDVMNPHFPKYYSGEEFPTDWQNPIPVYFLTVAPGTKFRFAVGWRGTVNTELQNRAQEWLMNGLMELGAGAKTSAGYGYFKKDGTTKEPAQVEEMVQTAAPVTPVQPARPSTRHTATGKVRYESGKPYVRSEEGKRWRVNWRELGMSNLKEKTLVEIEYDEFEDGTYKVVRVTKKGG